MFFAAALATSAAAKAIEVHPGPNALQHAIHAADPGDTLRVHGATYHEAVTVNKRVHIVGVGRKRPVIDGQCGTRYTVDVAANGVHLDHLKVVGGDEGFGPYPGEVDFTGLDSGRAQDLVVHNTCDAEYGINVNSSKRIKLIGNRGSGFDDSGIYIGDITSTGDGSLMVRGNSLFGNNRGIIVEDTVEHANVVVADNDSHDNDIPPGEGTPAGIFVHNSDGVRFAGNLLNGNGDGDTGYGIHFDLDSDHNRVLDNVARHNDTRNLLDEGTANCGSGNSFSIPHC
jgi:nitrous oxidase accessory protein NosD